MKNIFILIFLFFSFFLNANSFNRPYNFTDRIILKSENEAKKTIEKYLKNYKEDLYTINFKNNNYYLERINYYGVTESMMIFNNINSEENIFFTNSINKYNEISKICQNYYYSNIIIKEGRRFLSNENIIVDFKKYKPYKNNELIHNNKNIYIYEYKNNYASGMLKFKIKKSNIFVYILENPNKRIKYIENTFNNPPCKK